MHSHHAEDERGQALSVLVVMVVAAIFLVTGLVVDGGAKASAERRAESVAAEAARAAVDAGAVARAAGRPLDVGAVRSAGQRVINANGMSGSVELSGGVVSVRTSTSSPTIFVSAIGIASVTGTGEATASLER